MSIDQIIDQIYPLPQLSKEALIEKVSAITLPKAHVLFRAGKVESNIYFIRKGIVRAYASREAADITFWFGKEGQTIVSMKSYVAEEPGYEDIELLETCELYRLTVADLRKLYSTDIHIANWGRKFAEQELVKTEERLIAALCSTATQRYEALLRNHPDLLQRIPLGHIASYLGITQVTLSRIRAEIR